MKLKLIFLTLVAGMLLNPVANAQENLDGVYTIKQIITEDNKIKNFEYGGDIIVDGLKITLKTPTIKEEWIIENSNLKIRKYGFEEVNPYTNERFIYEKKKS